MKVLIVDDCQISTFILSTLMRKVKEDCIIEINNKPDKTFEIVDSFKPDVIFIDWIMPIINGLDLIEKIKNKTKSKIVFVTANDIDSDLINRLIKLDVDKFIMKPCTIDVLRNIINDLF